MVISRGLKIQSVTMFSQVLPLYRSAVTGGRQLGCSWLLGTVGQVGQVAARDADQALVRRRACKRGWPEQLALIASLALLRKCERPLGLPMCEAMI